ncbi:MAG TPA: apolipoprotein N-acyltransferase [Syntrophorhabdaceae bacterium]|nr:apolipoprotein N-acyltransferase [Syntrophorhabdaceae bacterium]
MKAIHSKGFLHGLNKYSLSFLSGILLVVIQPPISLFPLAFIALMPLFGSIKKDDLRFSFVSGYLTGLVSYLGLIYWVVIAMNRYGGIDIVSSFLILLLFVFYLSLYTGVFALSCAWFEKRFSVPLYLSAPLTWVALEYARGVLLSGFPWSFLAHSQYTFLPFIQVASITGAYFISFLIVAVNTIFFVLWKRGRMSPIYVVVIAALVALTLVYGFAKLSEKTERPHFKTAIVQGNVKQDVKWDEAFKVMTIKKYLQMTLSSVKDVDLVIWPETAMPFLFDREIYANKYIKALPGAVGSNLLFGTMSEDSSRRLRNSAYVIGKDGETEGVYNKVHLVPFGEYTPLISYFPFLAKLTAAGGDFSPGQSHEPIKTDIGSIGVLICYEGVFPSITNETVRRGAQVLVNLTNDAWYDRTSAPYEHFAFYVFRAIETDRYLLRAANTGISAVIDPNGRIEARTPIFTEDVLQGSFALRSTRTVYVRWGDYFMIIALLVLASAIGAGWRRRLRVEKKSLPQ